MQQKRKANPFVRFLIAFAIGWCVMLLLGRYWWLVAAGGIIFAIAAMALPRSRARRLLMLFADWLGI